MTHAIELETGKILNKCDTKLRRPRYFVVYNFHNS